jgi:hypothetical protein
VISPPRRSVTRFFIPLIDVLILLFCIFLLMPFVSTPAPDDGPKPEAKAPELPTDVQELRKQLAAAQKERDEARNRLDRFQKERGTGLVVRTLEIDPRTGFLIFYGPEKTEIRTQAMAEELVALQKQRAGEKDVHFVIRYPTGRDPAPVSRADRDKFEAWFKNVSHGYESY